MELKKKILLPSGKPYHILNSYIVNKKRVSYIITGISEQEDDELTKGKTITLIRGNDTFTITQNNLCFYGEIDFYNDDELDIIDDFNLLNYLTSRGVPIEAHYNYDEHCCYTTGKMIQMTETFSFSDLVLKGHGMIGKPKRVVVFNKIK